MSNCGFVYAFEGLFGPLLKLLATHFPHLTLVEDWLDDMSIRTEKKPVHIDEYMVVSAFNEIETNPSRYVLLTITSLGSDFF